MHIQKLTFRLSKGAYPANRQLCIHEICGMRCEINEIHVSSHSNVKTHASVIAWEAERLSQVSQSPLHVGTFLVWGTIAADSYGAIWDHECACKHHSRDLALLLRIEYPAVQHASPPSNTVHIQLDIDHTWWGDSNQVFAGCGTHADARYRDSTLSFWSEPRPHVNRQQEGKQTDVQVQMSQTIGVQKDAVSSGQHILWKRIVPGSHCPGHRHVLCKAYACNWAAKCECLN